jgi:5'(3')-deoxyribonucleotidase
MKQVLIDMDGVITDLLEKWVRIYNDEYHDDLTVEKFGSEFSGIHKMVKPECGEKIYEIIKRPGFVDDLTPIDGAIEGMEQLCCNKKLSVFVTTNCDVNPNMAKGKFIWLAKNLPFYDLKNTILVKPKYLICGDCLIDDYEKNLKEWFDFQMEYRAFDVSLFPILMDAPGNRNFDESTIPADRVFSWDELLYRIKEIF